MQDGSSYPQTPSGDQTMPVDEVAEHPSPQPGLARRRLFAALGAGSAVAAVALAGTRPAHAADDDEPVTVTSMAALRGLSASGPAAVVIGDTGQEGLFVRDAEDTDSPDNTGTVIVTGVGERYKREFTGALDVRWFGAKGDGVTDDSAAIQAAVDVAQTMGETSRQGYVTGRQLHFPGGLYALGSPIRFDPTERSLTVSGEGLSTQITSTGDDILEALFLFDTTRSERAGNWDIRNIFFLSGRDSNDQTNVVDAIRGHFTYSKFVDLRIYGFGRDGGAGVSIGYGWGNTFSRCLIQYCDTGIRSMDNEMNALNITECVIQRTVTAGIYLTPTGGGQSVQIRGCTIESNEGPAVWIEGATGVIEVSNCYFERNCTEPLTIADRPDPVHADLVFGTDLRRAGPIRIANNLVNLNTGREHDHGSFVIAHCADGGIEVVGTKVSNPAEPRTRSLVSIGPNSTPVYTVRNLVIRDTMVQRPETFELVEIDQLAQVVNHFHEASIDQVPTVNYCPTPSSFTSVAAHGGGSLTATDRTYRQFPVWELTTTGERSDVFGFEIDLDEYPELANRFVYFACWVRSKYADSGAVLWTSQLGDQVSEPSQATGWEVISYADRMPESGQVSIGIGALGPAAGSTVEIAKPVFAEVGARFEDFQPLSLALLAGIGRSEFLRGL